ncbi:CoB--CoM heterodisulfide reductase iron-sulfur subunit B family protein [Candidatus Bathyarchaeota archaeon]|nr:CoB--CoM heterodisulfide reductase iron-sulfur subunit B family protein [Candidatus Bathyarchaeota archaeon]
MTSYALFLGCTVPARQPSYELSSRIAMAKLGIELVDLDKTTCCAPPPIESVDSKTSIAVAAYNISLAEELDLDIVTLCNGCFQSLAKANTLLKKDEHLRKEVNEIIGKAGREFRGSKQVKHYLQVFTQDVGIDKIKANTTKKLSNLKVAAFYGCHIIRPSSLLKFDDAERPRMLDNLIETTGATSINYWNKPKCCGGLLRGYEDELALEIAREKVMNISKAKADCVVTVCPFCFVALDMGQLQMKTKFNDNYEVPVMHYPELLCLSLGVKSENLALNTHRTKVDSLLAKIN